MGRQENHTQSVYPEIPDKRLFGMGECAKLCLLKPHVLRYWEQKLPMSVRRINGRRFYSVEDIIALRQVRERLAHQGMTIEGAARELQGTAPPRADEGVDLQAIRHEVELALRVLS